MDAPTRCNAARSRAVPPARSWLPACPVVTGSTGMWASTSSSRTRATDRCTDEHVEHLAELVEIAPPRQCRQQRERFPRKCRHGNPGGQRRLSNQTSNQHWNIGRPLTQRRHIDAHAEPPAQIAAQCSFAQRFVDVAADTGNQSNVEGHPRPECIDINLAVAQHSGEPRLKRCRQLFEIGQQQRAAAASRPKM